MAWSRGRSIRSGLELGDDGGKEALASSLERIPVETDRPLLVLGERSGWLGMASAVQIGDASIRFHGLHASGAASEPSSPRASPSGAPDPAILDVDPGEPAFLVVWPVLDGRGVLRGAHVRCG
ncbi:MAG TPA: hypothetical protein RMH99_09880 [Sandaracinaceae bacterium LLY-WYZ-13_1]|nr:hypothetical protein [Sandaracinaceae bacterium LLY-WYZ-13_1]